jgi:hypothetical protein
MVLLFGIGEGEEKEQWVFWIFSLLALGLFHGGARIKIKQCSICGFCRG